MGIVVRLLQLLNLVVDAMTSFLTAPGSLAWVRLRTSLRVISMVSEMPNHKFHPFELTQETFVVRDCDQGFQGVRCIDMCPLRKEGGKEVILCLAP